MRERTIRVAGPLAIAVVLAVVLVLPHPSNAWHWALGISVLLSGGVLAMWEAKQ